MLLFYPVFLFPVMLRAIYRRIAVGKPSTNFATDNQGPYGTNPDYPCQWVFTKPFDDKEKLKRCFYELVEEAQIPKERAYIEFPDEVPADFPKTSGFAADHYVKGGKQLGGSSWGAWGLANLSEYVIGIRCFNGPKGKPTVWHGYMPGVAWDGTSCFNFQKELISRYYGKKTPGLFAAEQLKLSPEAAASLDKNTNFADYMCRVPHNLWSNMSDFMWQFYRSLPLLGGPGLLFRYTVLNFDKATTARIFAGLKAKGIKPFPGFVWAASEAFKNVLGYYPFGVTQQASMQLRSFEPLNKDRNLIGDWLIGPQARIRELGRDFTLQDAQAQYDELLKELVTMEGAVAHACEAKAYSLLNNGAATFEFFPFYGDEHKILDSLFFNNYGLRDVHKDAGFYSYNWGAPTGMCFNTICVNGYTCSCMATSVHSDDVLQAARDEAERLLLTLAEGKEGKAGLI